MNGSYSSYWFTPGALRATPSAPRYWMTFKGIGLTTPTSSPRPNPVSDDVPERLGSCLVSSVPSATLLGRDRRPSHGPTTRGTTSGGENGQSQPDPKQEATGCGRCVTNCECHPSTGQNPRYRRETIPVVLPAPLVPRPPKETSADSDPREPRGSCDTSVEYSLYLRKNNWSVVRFVGYTGNQDRCRIRTTFRRPPTSGTKRDTVDLYHH